MLVSGAICDKCRTAVQTGGGYTKKVLTDSLRKKGWQIGKRTICPNCKPKPKKVVLEY